MRSNNNLQVTFFQRKPREVGNYSLEFIFDDVRKRLAGKMKAITVYSRYESKGLFPRLYSCIEAFTKQGKINHVTGDINYVGILLKKTRTIHTILDCIHLSSSAGIKHKILKFFWLTLPLKRAAFVTAISESTKKEILKYVNYPADRIKVIYVAISQRFQRADKLFNQEKPRILQVGTAPNKNIPRLIEAIKGLNCTLVIVGRHIPEYENLLKQFQIDYEYKWGLSDDEILNEYNNADILSLASVYEGFGMPILEAQAIGRPVITTNLFSMAEVAGNAACIVDPYDIVSIRAGLDKIINDNAYREDLISKGFENIKRFDPDTIAQQYYALYQAVAAGE